LITDDNHIPFFLFEEDWSNYLKYSTPFKVPTLFTDATFLNFKGLLFLFKGSLKELLLNNSSLTYLLWPRMLFWTKSFPFELLLEEISFFSFYPCFMSGFPVPRKSRYRFCSLPPLFLTMLPFILSLLLLELLLDWLLFLDFVFFFKLWVLLSLIPLFFIFDDFLPFRAKGYHTAMLSGLSLR